MKHRQFCSPRSIVTKDNNVNLNHNDQTACTPSWQVYKPCGRCGFKVTLVYARFSFHQSLKPKPACTLIKSYNTPEIHLHACDCMDSNALAWHSLVLHTSKSYSKLGCNTTMKMYLWGFESKVHVQVYKTWYKALNSCILYMTTDNMLIPWHITTNLYPKIKMTI